MTLDQIRRAWVDAVLEGRMATAEYLAMALPEVEDGCELDGPPDECRDRWGCAGTILAW